MKKLLSIVISAVLVTGAMNFSVMANDDNLGSVSEDIKSTAAVNFVTGTSDNNAESNVQALKNAGFNVSNVYPTTGYVNKIFYQNEDGRNDVIALKQDNYSGNGDYNHNMPFIQVDCSEFNGKPFMAEVWVKGDGKITQQITLRENNENGGKKSEKSHSVKTTNWTKLGFSYDPNTKLLSYYTNGKLDKTETFDMTVHEIKFITLFEGDGSNTYNGVAYWDDIRVFEIPSYYVDVDYRNQTGSLSHGYGMSGTPYGGATTELRTGTEGNYMSVNYTAEGGAGWSVDGTVINNIYQGDFVAEMSIKPSANGNLVFCMRVVDPNNSSSKKEYRLFGIEKNAIKCGLDYEQVLTSDASPDKWYHLAAVYHKNENKVDVYLDGVKSKTIDMTATAGWNIDRFNLWYSEVQDENIATTEAGIGYLKIYKGSEIWQNVKHFGLESKDNALKAAAEIDSISGKSGRTLILAAYDGEGMLVNVNVGNSEDLSASLEQETDVTYKAYLWNSLDTLEPLYGLIATPNISENQ